MERSNQPPKTEGCFREGEPVDVQFCRSQRRGRSVPPGTCEPQAGVASGLSHSASNRSHAGGDAVGIAEPNISAAAPGEAAESLPGSQSVARAEGDARNWGGPDWSCRTNCESQAGKEWQRQEAVPEAVQGVGLARSTRGQGVSLEAGEGANTLTPAHRQPVPNERREPTGQASLGPLRALT